MTEYDNTNRGSVWKNDRKYEEWQPDFTGSINVEGVEFFIDAWRPKPGASERAPVLSFRVKRKDKQPAAAPAPTSPDFCPQPAPAAPPAPPVAEPFNDDVPF